jgi:hypothetical protein
VRSVRRLACQVGEAMRKSGDTAREQGLRAYRKLVKLTWPCVDSKYVGYDHNCLLARLVFVYVPYQAG